MAMRASSSSELQTVAYSTTPIMDALETFLRTNEKTMDEADKTALQALFGEQRVTTVKDCYDIIIYSKNEKIGLTVFRLTFKINSEPPSFSTFIEEAAKRQNVPPEEALGDQYFVDPKLKKKLFMYDNDTINSFKKAAVVATIPSQGFRHGTYKLILGPSGSGKSLYALRGVSKDIIAATPRAGNDVLAFTCLTTAKHCFKDLGTPTTAEEVAAQLPTLKAALARKARDLIDDKLVRNGCKKLSPNRKLNNSILFCMVLDEAGISECAHLWKTEVSIEDFAATLEEVAENYCLILAGTNLDGITSTIESTPDGNKIRMQQWSIRQFKLIVDHYAKPKTVEDAVINLVCNHRVLQQLVTNARCAQCLAVTAAKELDAYSDTSNRRSAQLELVNSVVRRVAECYLEANGLSSLKTLGFSKRLVARAIMRELYNGTYLDKYQDGTPKRGLNDNPQQHDDGSNDVGTELALPNYRRHFPEISGDGDPNYDLLAHMCTYVVDVHVEYSQNRLYLIGSNPYATSVSPAIAVVLAQLAGGFGSTTWTWSAFELVVGTGELLNRLRVMPFEDVENSIFLLQSPVQIPGKKKDKPNLPQNVGNVVVLNGAMSSYADIIAPYRLVQPKHTAVGKEATLHLMEELSKMGLANNMHYEKQNMLTAWLYRDGWQSFHALNPTQISDVRAPVEQPARSLHFPTEQLVESGEDEFELEIKELLKDVEERAESEDVDAVEAKIEDSDSNSSEESSKEYKEELVDYSYLDTAMSEETRAEMLREVTAVFVTNAPQFKIPCIVGKTLKKDAARLVNAAGKAKVLGLDLNLGIADPIMYARSLTIAILARVGDDRGTILILPSDVDAFGMLTEGGRNKMPQYIKDLGIRMQFIFYRTEAAPT